MNNDDVHFPQSPAGIFLIIPPLFSHSGTARGVSSILSASVGLKRIFTVRTEGMGPSPFIGLAKMGVPEPGIDGFSSPPSVSMVALSIGILHAMLKAKPAGCTTHGSVFSFEPALPLGTSLDSTDSTCGLVPTAAGESESSVPESDCESGV